MEGTTSYNFDDQILSEILSRLPLKSLMRFMCVCKSWQFLIQKDQWLIDLHHRRQSPCLLMMLFPTDKSSRDLDLLKFQSYWTANLFIDTDKQVTTTTTTVQAISSKVDLSACKHVKKPINGMICLIDKVEGKIRNGDYEDHAACLYNVITQEVTPWIRSTYLTRVEQWVDLSLVHVYRTYEFGFDPITKEYKVICIWDISGCMLPKFEGFGDYSFVEEDDMGGYSGYYKMCEILTLGKDTAWRRIDKIPLSTRHGSDYRVLYVNCSTYANGSIYWMSWKERDPKLVAFDVGSEEYRVMSDLDFVGRHDDFLLMELDGHLAIKNNIGNHTVNLWILDDDCDKNSTSTRDSSNIHWTKEIITLPSHWDYHRIRFHAVEGTEYLILECYHRNAVYNPMPLFVRSYNRRKKIFSLIQVTGDGSFSSSLGAYIGPPTHPLYMFTPYVESLLTLQRSYWPAAEDSSPTERAHYLVI